MDTRYGPVLNSIRGIWRVSDSLFGVPKFEGDDPVAGSSSSATSINVGASEPPTVLEEVGQGFRYIGLQARRRFLNFKKKIGLQTGHVDSAEHEPPRDAEAPRPQASPTATDTSDCTREEDDWMNVFSDTESVGPHITWSTFAWCCYAALAVTSLFSSHCDNFLF